MCKATMACVCDMYANTLSSCWLYKYMQPIDSLHLRVFTFQSNQFIAIYILTAPIHSFTNSCNFFFSSIE